jgi:hypothetical protein
VFGGTAMPVATVFANLEDDFTIEEIVQMDDGFTRGQDEAVLDFTAQGPDVAPPLIFILFDLLTKAVRRR